MASWNRPGVCRPAAEQLRRQARTAVHPGRRQLHGGGPRDLYIQAVSDQLWNSALAYFAGHDFRHAAAMLRLYMHDESRLRKAQALVDLGESELALGQTERALQSFNECIQQHSRDMAAIGPGCWRAGPR